MARCSFFSDTFAAPRGASWPFFLAFPRFSSSSAHFALHPSGSATSHEQGFLFCTPFAHPISDGLFYNLVAQFVGSGSSHHVPAYQRRQPAWHRPILPANLYWLAHYYDSVL